MAIEFTRYACRCCLARSTMATPKSESSSTTAKPSASSASRPAAEGPATSVKHGRPAASACTGGAGECRVSQHQAAHVAQRVSAKRWARASASPPALTQPQLPPRATTHQLDDGEHHGGELRSCARPRAHRVQQKVVVAALRRCHEALTPCHDRFSVHGATRQAQAPREGKHCAVAAVKSHRCNGERLACRAHRGDGGGGGG